MANRVTTTFDFRESGGLKKIKADIDSATTATGKFKAGVQGLWAEFSNNRAAQAAVAAVAVKIGKDAVNAASALQESANAVNTTFGETADGIEDLAEKSVNSYGLSERAFNQLAVAFSGFAKQVAGEGGDVVGTIDKMATRVADFASVHDLELADAMTKFQSALAGETEAVRRYGIDVSAAAVKTFAYANGITEVGDELTEAEKVQARYGLLMQETNQWAGDFANTMDSQANAARRLAAETENAQATLGDALLPVTEAATSAMVELAGAVDQVDRAIQGMSGGQADLGSTLGDTISSILLGNQYLAAAAEKYWEADEAVQAYDHSLTLTNDERQRSIDMLNGLSTTLKLSTRETTYNADANEEMGRIQRATTRVVDAATRAQEAFLRSIKFTRDEVGKLKREIDDRQAWLNLADTIDATRATLEDTTASARDQERAVLNLKEELIAYAEAVDLPDTQVTRLIAQIDQGKLNEATWLLAQLERSRQVNYIPVVQPPRAAGGYKFMDSGGAGRAGDVVAERRAEFVGGQLVSGPGVMLGGSASVTGGATTEEMLRSFLSKVGTGGSGAMHMVNVTVTVEPGADGTQAGRRVAEALERYYRNGGRRV